VPPSSAQLVSLALAERFLRRAAPPRSWNLTVEQFQIALERSAARKFSCGSPKASVSPQALEKYLESLQAGDLALACACSAGDEQAWEHFVAEYRPYLRGAAGAIAGESRARELADSLFADLFGLRESEGMRRSLFDYFHGRSKLTTWLHAILAQRHVDEIRRARKMEPLDDPSSDDGTVHISDTATKNHSHDPERASYLDMMQAAVEAALGALEPRDRLRLAYYYVEGLTLLEIGKLLGEHEATVSRKLDRARQDLRRAVETALRNEKKLSEAQLQLCYEYAREEWPFDLTRALSAPD